MRAGTAAAARGQQGIRQPGARRRVRQGVEHLREQRAGAGAGRVGRGAAGGRHARRRVRGRAARRRRKARAASGRRNRRLPRRARAAPGPARPGRRRTGRPRPGSQPEPLATTSPGGSSASAASSGAAAAGSKTSTGTRQAGQRRPAGEPRCRGRRPRPAGERVPARRAARRPWTAARSVISSSTALCGRSPAARARDVGQRIRERVGQPVRRGGERVRARCPRRPPGARRRLRGQAGVLRPYLERPVRPDAVNHQHRRSPLKLRG